MVRTAGRHCIRVVVLKFEPPSAPHCGALGGTVGHTGKLQANGGLCLRGVSMIKFYRGSALQKMRRAPAVFKIRL